MSVVRKYKKGGISNSPNKYSDYKEFIINQLQNQKFTNKGEREARNIANDWVNLVGSGEFDNIYSYDPITKEYSIKAENLPENLKNIDWGGSKDAIQTNIFGQLSVSPDKSNKGEEGNLVRKKFNTLFANWTNEFLSNKLTDKPSVVEFKIDDLSNYIKESHYGNNKDFEELWSSNKTNRLKNDPEAIKSDIMSKAREHLMAYSSKIASPGEGRSFKEIENFNSLLSAIDKKDWDSFTLESQKLGWNPEALAFIEPTETKPTKESDQPYVDKSKYVLKDVPAYIPPSSEQKQGTVETPKFEGLDINIDVLMPKTEERSVSVGDLPTIVDKIYYDIENNYELDAPRLGQIKWLWKNKHLLNINQQEKIKEIVQSLPSGHPELKQGGVIKLQSGNKILKAKISSGNTLHNFINSPMTSEKALSALSTAGDIASFVPGVGAIGAGTALVADVAKDIAKDGFQWSDILNANTAVNLGFTVLAGVGLGGLKNTLKLAKTAKNANKIINVEKSIGNLGKSASELNSAENLLNLVSKIKKPTAEKVVSVIEKVDKLDKNKIAKLINEKNVSKVDPLKIKNQLAEDFNVLLINENKKSKLSKAINLGKNAIESNTAKNISRFALAYPTFNSAQNIGKQIIDSEGKLGNITLEDVGNLSMTGVASKNFFKDKRLTKAFNRQTISDKTPSKTSVTFVNPEGKIINTGTITGDLPIKESLKLKNQLYKRSSTKKEIDEKYTKEIIDKYNKSVSPDKQIPLDSTIKDLQEISPSYVNNLRLREKPLITPEKGVQKSRKEYEEVKKLLNKEGLLVIDSPETKKVIKELSDPEKKYISKLSKVLKDVDPKLRSIVKQWENKPKKFKGYDTTIKNLSNKKQKTISKIKKVKEMKEGGIISMQWGGIKWSGSRVDYPGIYDTGRKGPLILPYANQSRIDLPVGYTNNSSWRMPIQAFPVYPKFKVVSSENIDKPISTPEVVNNQNQEKPSVENIENKSTSNEGFVPNYNTMFGKLKVVPFNTTIKGTTPVTNEKVVGGSAESKSNKFKLKDINLDRTDLLNTIGYLGTLTSNAKINRAQKRAALSEILNLKGPSRQYFRTPLLTSPFYESQVGKINSAANRLSSSISDFDKRAGVMLSAIKQGNELREKGQLSDQQIAQSVIDKQMQSDAQIDAMRTDIVNKNAMSVAGASKAINLIDANKVLANNTAFQNFIHSYNQNRLATKQEAKYKDYYKLMSDPKYKDLYKQYSSLTEEAKKSKEQWDKNKVEGAVPVGTWQESDSFKQLESKRKNIEAMLDEYKTKLQGASMALQMPTFAKGGSLEDKKELLRYKSLIKRNEDAKKELYKTLLKNNELMLKSLIKVFK